MKTPLIGIEIGTRKTCAVIAAEQPGGHLRILGEGVTVSHGVRKGEIVDFTQALESVEAALAEAEHQSGIEAKSVHVAVNGASAAANTAGTAAPVRNSVRWARTLGLQVNEFVFGPLAAARALLAADASSRDALVIDIGAGTSGYVLFRRGSASHQGCIPIAGDNISNDLSTFLGLPLPVAETLKVSKASALVDESDREIAFTYERNLVKRKIVRQEVNKIVQCRIRQIFMLIRKQLESAGELASSAGLCVHLSGGTAVMDGVDAIAREVFGGPAGVTPVRGILGPDHLISNPAYHCVLGLLKSTSAPQERCTAAEARQRHGVVC